MSRRHLCVLLGMAAAVTCASPSTRLAAQSTGGSVVISQVYGGGGNSGATLRNDFIEIFNRSAAAVDLTGWSVQYASAAGTTWQVTPLAGSIAPGSYYLIREAAGAGGTEDLPPPDALGAIPMAAGSGKVALVSVGTALSGACPSATTLVDFVGYGAANCSEGGATAPALANTTAAVRKLNGCQDNGNNAGDFEELAPAPRNSASPVESCAPPTLRLPHEIQGNGSESPFDGQLTAVEGIVTARKLNGFFVQTEPGREDGDPATSEGLFIFTGAAPPPTASEGHLARITGRVQEFVPSADPGSPPVTEVTASVVEDLGPATALPAAIELSAMLPDSTGAFDQLERFEGMRVVVASLTVVAPTQGEVIESTDVAETTGVFVAVVTGVPRPLREAGIPVSAPVPPCGGCTPPRFDTNPELIRVDSDAVEGMPAVDVATGATVANISGVLDYAFRLYTIAPTTPMAPVGGLVAAPVRTAEATEFTVASANLQRFFDTTNDPAIGEPVVTPEAYARRLAKASRIVRDYLRLPDIVGVQEVENLAVLQDIAARVNSDAGLGADYVAFVEEGNDPGGIDVGVLVRSSRVKDVSVIQVGKETTFVDPQDGSVDLLNDRPSLVLRGRVEGSPTRLPADVIVVVNHLRSLNDVDQDPGAGPRVREKRRRQAEFLASLLDGLQEEGRVISVGDYNAFEVNDGYVDVLGTIVGTPTAPEQVVLASVDLVEPDFVRAAHPGDYSYVFSGSAQSLDHILLSTAAAALATDFEHARINADFPEVLRHMLDPVTGQPRPERLSDHDPAVAYFAFPPDTTAPVIDAVPADITVTATSPAGAVVTWSTPAALDNLDGPVDVSCAPSSGATLPIGVTTVVCSASDAAGNAATASFGVTVLDPATAGVLAGAGRVSPPGSRVSFVFAAFESGAVQTGVAAITVLRTGGVDTLAVLQPSVVFFLPGTRAVLLQGTGFWNGRGGYAFEIGAHDLGEPGRNRDTFSVVVRDPSGMEVLRASGTLTDGNIR